MQRSGGNVPFNGFSPGKGFFKIVRWKNLLIIAISQYLTAIFLIGPRAVFKQYLADSNLFFICLGTIMIAAAGYIINDYYDVKIDYINKPKKVIVGTLLKRRVAMFIHSGLNVLGIIAGIIVSLKIGVINLIASVWLWGYSNQLKRMPFIGNLSVALMSGMAIAIIGIHYQPESTVVYVYAVFAFFISLIREIVKDLEDVKGDATFGCKTLPVIWGIRPTKWLVYFLIFLFSLILIRMSWEIGSHTVFIYFAIMSLPAVVFLYRLGIADTSRQFQTLSSYLKFFMLLGILSMVLI